VGLDDGFYEVEVRELIVDFSRTFRFHYEVGVLANSVIDFSLCISIS
jgi:hypothetical protein